MPGKKTLKITDVEWVGGIFLDQNTATFIRDGVYYKAVLPSAGPWFRDGTAIALARNLAHKNLLPGIEVADIAIEGLGPVFVQDTEYYSVDCSDYCPEMLREAALLFCELNLTLLRRGFSLLDGHGGNMVLQGASRPKWCDIGSITQVHLRYPFVGLDEFLGTMVYPLLLRQKSPHLAAIASASMTRREAFSRAAAAALDMLPDFPKGDREALLLYIKEVIESIRFEYLKTAWGDYHDVSQTAAWRTSNRYLIFTKMFRALSPKTVIDFGANAGAYSRIMADSGAEVLAIDPDETAVAKHFHLLRETGYDKRIKLKIGAVWFTGSEKAADLVVALALSHHLYLSQGWKWKSMAQFFARHTNDALITEYMPNGLGHKKKPRHLPEDYTQERFMEQLQRYFSSVEAVEYDYSGEMDSPRIFVLCRGKKAVPDDDGYGPLPVIPGA